MCFFELVNFSFFEAYLMSHFTFVIYDPEMATIHVDAAEWGWNLVGYAASLPSEPQADEACRSHQPNLN